MSTRQKLKKILNCCVFKNLFLLYLSILSIQWFLLGSAKASNNNRTLRAVVMVKLTAKTRVRIQSLATFIEQLSTVNCLLKRQK